MRLINTLYFVLFCTETTLFQALSLTSSYNYLSTFTREHAYIYIHTHIYIYTYTANKMATTTTTTTSVAKYDLTHTLAPFLDAHLFWDIFNHLENNANSCYSKEDLLNAKLELVRQTNMVDMEMQIVQQLNSNEAASMDFQGKKESVDKRCKELHDQAGKLVDLIENDFDTVKELTENENFNMVYLQENNNVTSENLNALYKYGKELFNCGSYNEALFYLNYYVRLDPFSNQGFSALWGKLACNILANTDKGCEAAWTDLKYIADEWVDKSKFSATMTLEYRAWLLHWSIFIFFNKNNSNGREQIVEFLLLKDKHLNAIQNYCPWLLRYLAAAVVISKKGRRSGDLLKKVVRITQQERYTYKDPITQFVEALYVDFDFEGAQNMLKECEKVFEVDSFLYKFKDDFMNNSRSFIFETYFRIHKKIHIDMVAEKLNKTPDEAERWIVNLIRNARLNAKINSEEKYVVMQSKYPSIYQRMMEKTKNLQYTTYVLADNLREFYTESQQRAADLKAEKEKIAKAKAEEEKKAEEERKQKEEEEKKKAEAATPKMAWGRAR
jgi:translation initiation factor 3 subunit E